MEITGFNFIWYCYRKMAPRLNIYSGIYRQRHRQWLLESMECSSGGETNGRLLKRVLSVSLDPKKSWFALNSALCSGKPSRFCSLAYAQVFPDEYRQIDFDDLLGDNGVPASASWFSADGRRTEKVYVASAFGLVLGILRQKSLDELPFIHSEDFQMIVSWINAFNLSACLPPTPPSTPSPPKPKSAPFPEDVLPKSKKRPRTLNELKANEDLSPAFKKKKIRETAVNVMNEMTKVCEENGESLSTVLGECCSLTGKAGHDAREVFMTVFDSFAQEKGVRVAFSKLLSEEAWDERVKSMRVPDWIYLLFKLKSRISDSAWQDLTNLTKLGRTGVSCTQCLYMYSLVSLFIAFTVLCLLLFFIEIVEMDLFWSGGGGGEGGGIHSQQEFWCDIVFFLSL